MTRSLTEDQVRDIAGRALELEVGDDAQSGVGQITTFNQLGFTGVNDKPDGWYLPDDKGAVAIILETKATKFNLETQKWVDEIKKNCTIAMTKYKNVIGILYNGNEVRCFKNNDPVDVAPELQKKGYYFELFLNEGIDKQKIFSLTAKINNCLHSDFGIKNLYHRMIFTACALVAKRYGAFMQAGMDYSTFHNSISSSLNKELIRDRAQNQKLNLLVEVYSEIKMNVNVNSEDEKEQEHVKGLIGQFIGWVEEISDSINSNEWNGEDVMGIFFNEFNRYKKKSESGQVFTPDHITSFMYRLIDVNKDDVVLDAACGSGAFLVKSMSNMIKEAGGITTKKAKAIKSNQLYGIEFDREIFALACANMLIHKDGKTNLTHLDSRYEPASDWIKNRPKAVTKVLMNPPYEKSHGCIQIVENVLDSVPAKTKCAFILPDKKLEKSGSIPANLLKRHRLTNIVKLPENLFFNVGVTTSVFIFETGVPQRDREVFGMYIEEDGLRTVKNQGRHDVLGVWPDLEDYWISAFHKRCDTRYGTDQWIDPNERLSYQTPQEAFDVEVSDFREVAMDYLMFQRGVDVSELNQKIFDHVMYQASVMQQGDGVVFKVGGSTDGT